MLIEQYKYRETLIDQKYERVLKKRGNTGNLKKQRSNNGDLTNIGVKDNIKPEDCVINLVGVGELDRNGIDALLKTAPDNISEDSSICENRPEGKGRRTEENLVKQILTVEETPNENIFRKQYEQLLNNLNLTKNGTLDNRLSTNASLNYSDLNEYFKDQIDKYKARAEERNVKENINVGPLQTVNGTDIAMVFEKIKKLQLESDVKSNAKIKAFSENYIDQLKTKLDKETDTESDFLDKNDLRFDNKKGNDASFNTNKNDRLEEDQAMLKSLYKLQRTQSVGNFNKYSTLFRHFGINTTILKTIKESGTEKCSEMEHGDENKEAVNETGKHSKESNGVLKVCLQQSTPKSFVNPLMGAAQNEVPDEPNTHEGMRSQSISEIQNRRRKKTKSPHTLPQRVKDDNLIQLSHISENNPRIIGKNISDCNFLEEIRKLESKHENTPDHDNVEDDFKYHIELENVVISHIEQALQKHESDSFVNNNDMDNSSAKDEDSAIIKISSGGNVNAGKSELKSNEKLPDKSTLVKPVQTPETVMNANKNDTGKETPRNKPRMNIRNNLLSLNTNINAKFNSTKTKIQEKYPNILNKRSKNSKNTLPPKSKAPNMLEIPSTKCSKLDKRKSKRFYLINKNKVRGNVPKQNMDMEIQHETELTSLNYRSSFEPSNQINQSSQNPSNETNQSSSKPNNQSNQSNHNLTRQVSNKNVLLGTIASSIIVSQTRTDNQQKQPLDTIETNVGKDKEESKRQTNMKEVSQAISKSCKDVPYCNVRSETQPSLAKSSKVTSTPKKVTIVSTKCKPRIEKRPSFVPVRKTANALEFKRNKYPFTPLINRRCSRKHGVLSKSETLRKSL